MRPKYLIPFIDVLFTFLLVFVSMTMLIKVKVENDEKATFQQANAVYLVVLNWEGDCDLDLWGRDPGGRIVSFHRREGAPGSLFSLNRDCLGASTTEVGEDGKIVSKVNEEIISLRGTFTGEYVFNVHAYNMKGQAKAKATVKLVQNKPYKVIVEKTKELTASGEEQTFFRFTTDKDSVVSDINDLPASLTTEQQGQQ